MPHVPFGGLSGQFDVQGVPDKNTPCTPFHSWAVSFRGSAQDHDRNRPYPRQLLKNLLKTVESVWKSAVFFVPLRSAKKAECRQVGAKVLINN